MLKKPVLVLTDAAPRDGNIGLCPVRPADMLFAVFNLRPKGSPLPNSAGYNPAGLTDCKSMLLRGGVFQPSSSGP